MNVELLCQLGQRLLALDGGQSHLRLESRCVVPARSSGHCFSYAARILAAFRQKLHLSRCSDFQSQLSMPDNHLSLSAPCCGGDSQLLPVARLGELLGRVAVPPLGSQMVGLGAAC